MKDPNLTNQYENFRSSVVAAINSLDIDEAQKQIFMMSLQVLYLQMLTAIPSNFQPVIQPEIAS